MTNLQQAEKSAAVFKPPYPPSLTDRVLRAIGKLPVSHWVVFAGVFIMIAGFNLVCSWIDGWLPAFEISTISMIYPVWLVTPLALIIHLNRVALKSLRTFSPLLHLDEAGLKHLEYEFTTMPNRGVILTGLLWIPVYILLNVISYQAFFVGYGLSPAMATLTFFEGLFTFMIGGVIYYHSFRQLRLVHQTVMTARKFNLFQLDPVYAFSGLTAQTGIGWIFLLTASYITFPIQLANQLYFMMLVLQVFLAAAAFVLPLWVVQRRLVREKRRLLSELNARAQTLVERNNRCLDEGQLGEMEQLNHAFTALQAERDIINAIPTWPWRTETLTAFLSATVLPLALFIVQLVIQRLMG